MVRGVFSFSLDAQAGSARSVGLKSDRLAFTLRHYIGDRENELVRIAAERFLAPSPRFNPLVLVGPTGVGKSLLARCLVRRWKQEHSHAKVIVTSGADFARSYATAVETDALADWHTKFAKSSLLVLEDLQQLAGKRGAQQDLAGLIDSLLDGDCRLLFSADHHPLELANLSSHLSSRLSAGLVVPLCPPGPAARQEIVRRLAENQRLELTDPTLATLANRLPVTVPQLNHALAELAQRATHDNGTIAPELVRSYTDGHVASQQPSLRTIATKVAQFFNVRLADLKGPGRQQSVVRARATAIYLARQLTGKSLKDLGRYFGGRDHTTVLHACRSIQSLAQSDNETRMVLDELSTRLSPS